MTMKTARNGHQSAEAFDYFVVRLSRMPDYPARLAGVVERLGSSEKRWFGGGDHLLWLMTAWPDEASAGTALHPDQRGSASREREEAAR